MGAEPSVNYLSGSLASYRKNKSASALLFRESRGISEQEKTQVSLLELQNAFLEWSRRSKEIIMTN